MSTHLVVVESPAKAKTIEKYLGKDYQVLASYGHVSDLLPKKGSVDPDHEFAMRYTLIEKNARHVEAIAKALKKADSLLLATDPDREGEAISWHVYELMKSRGLLDKKPVHRIFFNEITKTAILQAISEPRSISMDLVNAQQARRALDYLVGFNLSPLLWKKIRRGLSAGRVQSPALRLIVEREEEIERFEPKEYWKVIAKCAKDDGKFSARLINYDKQKLQQFSITNSDVAFDIKSSIEKKAAGLLTVISVDKKQRKRNPAAPFITSTLQQEAARKLGFTARKTMMVAQQLYEGIEINTGTSGLITYMRTDSVHMATEAITEIHAYITKTYGESYGLKNPRQFKTKSKNAQEAHEAIRPTQITHVPQSLQSYLTADQFKLYQLIWQRTVASQMAEALIDTVAVDLGQADTYVFRANGSTIAFPGFLAVYEEGIDDKPEDDEEGLLPPLAVNDKINLLDLEANQHFTEPPPRYSEASLVKALEEFDIGRPSTYATIIHTLQQRDYVVVDKKRFMPTDVGRIVSHFLTQYFTQYVDYQFTAGLEDTLDEIARGERTWIPVLDDFWKPFIQQIQTIESEVKRKDVTTETLDEACPQCGKPLLIRLGKRGRFIGCSGYPDCDYTKPLDGDASENVAQEIVEGRTCPLCEGSLHIKAGPYGRFIGCGNYPNCKFIEPLERPSETDVTCPQCNQSKIVKRKTRRGKFFYACSGYPKCKYALWYEPINKSCPQCKWPILMIKETKRKGRELVCPQKECGHTEAAD